MYHGTFWDYATLYGSIGLFLSLLFLFIRFLPVISIAEMRELVHETQERAARAGLRCTEGRRPMSTPSSGDTEIYGLMAEFDSPDDLLEATREAYERGLSNDGGLYALPRRGAGRGPGLPSQPGSGVVFIGRLARRTHGLSSCSGTRR